MRSGSNGTNSDQHTSKNVEENRPISISEVHIDVADYTGSHLKSSSTDGANGDQHGSQTKLEGTRPVSASHVHLDVKNPIRSWNPSGPDYQIPAGNTANRLAQVEAKMEELNPRKTSGPHLVHSVMPGPKTSSSSKLLGKKSQLNNSAIDTDETIVKTRYTDDSNSIPSTNQQDLARVSPSLDCDDSTTHFGSSQQPNGSRENQGGHDNDGYETDSDDASLDLHAHTHHKQNQRKRSSASQSHLDHDESCSHSHHQNDSQENHKKKKEPSKSRLHVGLSVLRKKLKSAGALKVSKSKKSTTYTTTEVDNLTETETLSDTDCEVYYSANDDEISQDLGTRSAAIPSNSGAPRMDHTNGPNDSNSLQLGFEDKSSVQRNHNNQDVDDSEQSSIPLVHSADVPVRNNSSIDVESELSNPRSGRLDVRNASETRDLNHESKEHRPRYIPGEVKEQIRHLKRHLTPLIDTHDFQDSVDQQTLRINNDGTNSQPTNQLINQPMENNDRSELPRNGANRNHDLDVRRYSRRVRQYQDQQEAMEDNNLEVEVQGGTSNRERTSYLQRESDGDLVDRRRDRSLSEGTRVQYRYYGGDADRENNDLQGGAQSQAQDGETSDRIHPRIYSPENRRSSKSNVFRLDPRDDTDPKIITNAEWKIQKAEIELRYAKSRESIANKKYEKRLNLTKENTIWGQFKKNRTLFVIGSLFLGMSVLVALIRKRRHKSALERAKRSSERWSLRGQAIKNELRNAKEELRDRQLCDQIIQSGAVPAPRVDDVYGVRGKKDAMKMSYTDVKRHNRNGIDVVDHSSVIRAAHIANEDNRMDYHFKELAMQAISQDQERINDGKNPIFCTALMVDSENQRSRKIESFLDEAKLDKNNPLTAFFACEHAYDPENALKRYQYNDDLQSEHYDYFAMDKIFDRARYLDNDNAVNLVQSKTKNPQGALRATHVERVEGRRIQNQAMAGYTTSL